jgi:photosystem II stability/assembly factor-like uncharacterized protein
MTNLQRSLVVLLLITPHVLLGSEAEPPEFRRGEKGCQGARVLEHLERHGDYGQIDPEALLYLTRVEHERRVVERRQGLSSEAIAGNVWTSIGPTNGAGRTIAIAIHPTQADTAIIGTAGGGAWRTTSRGIVWTPLTETVPNLSAGAVAYAPSDPNRVYLGTGEGGYASDFIPGIGLLTSDDGGNNWTLPSTVVASMFYRISVHPSNPDDLVIATNRGALRSTTGPNGPWTTVIPSLNGLVDGYGDVADLVRHPANPSVLYAATYDRGRWCVRNTCTPTSNIFLSPRVLKSTDGGTTWTAASTGLPLSTFSTRVERMSLAIAPSSPDTLYVLTAIFNADSGTTRSHVYKTTDGGASWSETGLTNSDDPRVFNILGTQGWYDNTIVVAPNDPNIVIVGGVYYARTMDGGATWSFPFAGAMPHVDVHDLRYDSNGVLWIANDGGVWVSTDHASSASARNQGLVTRQYYAMASDPVNRKRILGGTQDNGTNFRTDSGGTQWGNFSGGDGFQCFVNPDAPGVAFSTYQFAELNRTKTASSVTPLIAPSGPVFAEGERTPFFSIVKADPSNPATLYLGTTRVWKSTTAGESWVPLSTQTIGTSVWPDDVTVRSLAVAPGDPSTIMISKGSRVYRTTDGGASWHVQFNGLPGRTVTNVAISPIDGNVAFATIAGTAGQSVYKTTDGGSSWTSSGTGLPSFSALVIRFDPTDASTLYTGTDVGIFRSTDSGANWSRFGTGMPAVSVYDIDILPDGSVFRVATHGRGIWELNVAGVTNRPPSVSISSPSSALTVSRGQVITFTGAATDADGDAPGLQWTFPDDWSKRGGTSASHVFHRAGTWPVALIATDSTGARGGAEVLVTVKESSDDCATPIVVSPAGPFPWSVTVDSEVATTQTTFEPVMGGSCYPYRPERTMWISFTPEVSATYSFSLCSSQVEGFLSAYSGPACGPHTALPMCITNTELSGNCGDDPQATLDLVAGTQYRFLVGNYYAKRYGALTVTIELDTAVAGAIRSVSPATGPVAGGTRVVLTGDGFQEGAAVRFGGVQATNVTVVSSSVITATVPAHVEATVDVQVTMGGQIMTASRAFTYATSPAQGRRRAARK